MEAGLPTFKHLTHPTVHVIFPMGVAFSEQED